jgi:hypothetical protein
MSRPAPLVESLENRRLLAATPAYSPLSPGYGGLGFYMSPAQQRQATKAAEYQAAVDKSIAIGKAHNIQPSILGAWNGRVKGGIAFVKKSFDITLDITAVKPNFAKGTLTIDGKTYSGKIPGKTKPTHEFSYTFTRGKDSVQVDGLLNGLNTAATGAISARYEGWNIKGTFSVTKVKATA